ncbi:kinetochore-associated protein KNL-2 homolog [Abrus precatorius]|uniref:Kinetochore-associated protein KNL-2 homolog n=1 Tax=Abrus precatorius TaxID=3816 RepID=A0A8B8MLU2_ABRPR|nr:kinetochore-associated protein KNL-2 homolog [Abrus precatorius]
MDSTPIATTPSHTESSSFRRTVSLYDWWLVKAKNDFQGKRLAVAGVSSRKDEAVRVFVSAPVVKRCHFFSLETVDGICVLLSGFINAQRTLENGFTAQVCNRFLIGFPRDWETLVCFREVSSTGTDSGSAFPDYVSATSPEILSDVVEKYVPTSLTSVEETPGDREKSFPKSECDVLKEMGGANVAYDSGGNRHSARLHSIRVCEQKQQLALISKSEQIVKVSVSRISRTLSAKSEGCYKKKSVSVETKVGRDKKKLIESPSAVKNLQEKDVSHLIKGSKQN